MSSSTVLLACALAGATIVLGARSSDLARAADAPAPSTAPSEWRLAAFEADVTPPLGHPLFGNGTFRGARSVTDPLLAKGVVLDGPGGPVVLAAVDWCELRNDAYDRWRDALAEAAGTTRQRVLVSCVHQHDAPYVDLIALDLLAAAPNPVRMGDRAFHEEAVRRVAGAVAEARKAARRVTHVGVGRAKVDRVASNRRVERPDGTVRFDRYSACKDPVLRALPDGEIDPWLRTVSFWAGDAPLAAVSAYAVHPMSHYGSFDVTADFVGIARQRRQADEPRVSQIYLTGCCGDVTAGKYNDGSPANREVLAGRVYDAMVAAWASTERHPLTTVDCRSVPIILPHSELPEMGEAALEARLRAAPTVIERVEAAMGLSSLRRDRHGHPIDVQAIDLGAAQIVLLPAESFVAYQLFAQQLRPDGFVVAVGFGEASAGYLPTDRAFAEAFREEHGYCWVRPGAERLLTDALRQVLAP